MPKRLHRSRTERWVAGVCGGLSDYFNVDVMALRVGFALLTLWNGFGLVLYLLLVVLIPDEPLTEVVTEPGLPPPPEEGEPQRRARVLGSILVLGGAYLFIQETRLFEVLLHQPWIGALLIMGGLIVLVMRPRRKP